MNFLYHKIILTIIALCISLAAWSNDTDDNILSQITDTSPTLPKDIAPNFNRHMHNFNFFLDRNFVRPPAKIYRKIVPPKARRSVGNFFNNLSEPYSAINNFAQGESEQGGNNLRRFVLNSTFGLFGLFDFADSIGHHANDEDLGQTLAVWGVGDGGYIVLPFFGPGTLRSAFGGASDNFLDPIPQTIFNEMGVEGRVTVQYVTLVNERADNVQAFEDLEANSLDFYQAVRAFYWQNRLKDIAE